MAQVPCQLGTCGRLARAWLGQWAAALFVGLGRITAVGRILRVAARAPCPIWEKNRHPVGDSEMDAKLDAQW